MSGRWPVASAAYFAIFVATMNFSLLRLEMKLKSKASKICHHWVLRII